MQQPKTTIGILRWDNIYNDKEINMQQILKPSELKSLRISHGVSQAQLSRDLEIQRSYISQFEHGKYVFDDEILTAMKEYFESVDMLNDEPEISPADIGLDPIVRDGLLVPGGLEVEEVETGFDGLNSCLESFHQVCQRDLPKGFLLGGIDEEKLAEYQLEAGVIAIRALNHIMELQGRQLFDLEESGELADSLLEML
jgi:transcriptional regulator with XRE-family HTH domain